MRKKLPEWVHNPPTDLKTKTLLIKHNIHWIRSKGPRGRCLRQMYKEVKEETDVLTEQARTLQPLAWFKPSYEQALILNAWMYGISFVCTYTANRIGKTTAAIVNILLWLIPNNPKWKIFQPYTDKWGRRVQVFPRPPIASVKRIHKFITKHRIVLDLAPDPSLPPTAPCNKHTLQSLQSHLSPNPLKPAWPNHPWAKGGTVWSGGPDHDHHEKILFPLWKEYIPSPILDRYSPSQKEITLKIWSTNPYPTPNPSHPLPTDAAHRSFKPRCTVWEIIGKSYESKDTKWSSGAVDIITLTEGVTKETMEEIKLRFKDPGVGGHDFTPYEPANSGAASHLAQQIFKGTYVLPITTHVFTKFSMRMAPEHIMSEELREKRIASYEGTPQAAARIDGEFYTSSALVLSHLNRNHHLLPYTHEQFKILIRHSGIRPQIIRGLDPGLDHPTACAWAYLLPSNQYVVFRILSQRNLTIPARCKRVVELSNNKIEKVYYGKRTNDSTEFYSIETHPNPDSEVALVTIADYHTFKEDEITGQEYSLNYTLSGLPITESVHIGPEERALSLDSDLQLNQYLPSLQPDEATRLIFTKHNTNHKNHGKMPLSLQSLQSTTEVATTLLPSLQGMPPGAKVYFLQYAMGVMPTFLLWEDFYWERKKSGEDKGQPKDQIPIHGDDELDALTYITCSQYKWTNYQPPARLAKDSEPEDDMIELARLQEPRKLTQHSGNDDDEDDNDSPISGLQSLQRRRTFVPPTITIFGDEENVTNHTSVAQ